VGICSHGYFHNDRPSIQSGSTMSKEGSSIVIFGWLNDAGTIEWRRDKIVDNVRKVVRNSKNSSYFMESINREYDKQFKKSAK